MAQVCKNILCNEKINWKKFTNYRYFDVEGGGKLRANPIFKFKKKILIKVSHFMIDHLKHNWFSLVLTLWCLEQKPKAVAFGARF